MNNKASTTLEKLENKYRVAKNALCRIINCDINKSTLRWTESAGDIFIHDSFNKSVVCRTAIYPNSDSSSSSYYLYFCHKKYKDAAAGIEDPNLLSVTSAEGYKFKDAGNVINFVKEVVRRADYMEFKNMKKTDYAKHDCDATYNLSTTLELPTIRGVDVIFNNPATIVLWSDGTKTVVKCRDDEEFDPEKGLALALAKKAMGNRYNYYDVFKKYIGKYNKKKFKKALDEAMKITPDEIIHNGHRYELVDHIVEARPKDDTQEAQNKALRDIALNTAKNLRAEGKSLAEIAKIMGYDDPAVVRTILPDEEDTNNEV